MITAVRIVDGSKFRSPAVNYSYPGGWRVVVGRNGGLLATLPGRQDMSEDRARAILLRYISKARAAQLDLDLCHLPHLEKIERHYTQVDPLVPIPITWIQCEASCPGWCHMEDPREVQACDLCDRFRTWDKAAITDHGGGNPRGAWVSRDDLAQLAHARECGCSWGKDTAPMSGHAYCAGDEDCFNLVPDNGQDDVCTDCEG